jgi:demethylmenaquinone methyltransferase/2-methoxy-6-polyprenyl-1,4-benzoquinol methylase
MPEGKAVKTMFAGIAAKYDAANHLLSGCFDFYWRYRLSQKVKAAHPKSVIDLATGSGDVAFKLRDQLPDSCTIKGMDFCQPMLEEARRKSQLHEKYAALQFELGDCMDLPLEDNCCDAVTLSFGLRNFENRDQGLREILRILKPTGTLFVLEFTQPLWLLRPFYYAYLNYCLPWVARFATGDKAAYDYLAGSIAEFPKRSELAQELKAAGFSAVSHQGMTGSVVALHCASKGSAK